MDGGLPGGIHLRAGLHDVAHDNCFHLLGMKSGPFDGTGNRHGTETGSRHILEGAAKGADCSTNGLCENN